MSPSYPYKQLISVVWTGNEESMQTIDLPIKKHGQKIELLGVLIGLPGTTLKLSTAVRHLAPHTKSETRIHAILFGDATIEYKGLVSMPKGNPDSHGTLHVRTILMSDAARMKALPALEIEENQVTASHGVAISRLDKNQLFYLQSRGLSELEATRLILEGFAEIILSRIGDPKATARVHQAITKSLSSLHSPSR